MRVLFFKFFFFVFLHFVAVLEQTGEKFEQEQEKLKISPEIFSRVIMTFRFFFALFVDGSGNKLGTLSLDFSFQSSLISRPVSHFYRCHSVSVGWANAFLIATL